MKKKKCPICGKNKLIGTKESFYCKFCGFTHSKEKKAQFVEFST